MQVTWLGWSGFRIATAGRSLLLDAHFGGLEARQPIPPEGWGRDADAIIVSHGHYDHCGVVPQLMERNPDAPLISSRPVLGFAEKRWRIAAERLHRSPYVDDDLEIDHLDGIHIARTPLQSALLVARWSLLRRGSVRVLGQQRDASPSFAPIKAVRIRSGEGTLLHACELLHRRTDFREVAGWLGGQPLGVLLAGAEPGEERSVLRGVTVLRPRHVVLFSPHQDTRDHFDGRRAKRADLAGLAERIRALAWGPTCRVAALDSTIDIDLVPGSEAA